MVNPKRDPDSDEEDEELVADGKLKLIVAHNGDETAFVVKPTTTFDKVRNVVGKKYGLEPGQIRLYSDSGERCAETNTPKMMEMMAGRTYQLRVEMQQLGGGQ